MSCPRNSFTSLRVQILLGLLLGSSLLACAADRIAEPVLVPPGTTAEAAGGVVLNDAVLRQWTHSCALCHVSGNGGAPRVGNTDEWRLRVEQGVEVLYQHTVEGFNNMPPLGYCMSCERDDFMAMIEFMVDVSR